MTMVQLPRGLRTTSFISKSPDLQSKILTLSTLIMGFFQQALKVFGKKTVVKRVRSLSSGDNDIYFQFELKDS